MDRVVGEESGYGTFVVRKRLETGLLLVKYHTYSHKVAYSCPYRALTKGFVCMIFRIRFKKLSSRSQFVAKPFITTYQ